MADRPVVGSGSGKSEPKHEPIRDTGKHPVAKELAEDMKTDIQKELETLTGAAHAANATVESCREAVDTACTNINMRLSPGAGA